MEVFQAQTQPSLSIVINILQKHHSHLLHGILDTHLPWKQSTSGYTIPPNIAVFAATWRKKESPLQNRGILKWPYLRPCCGPSPIMDRPRAVQIPSLAFLSPRTVSPLLPVPKAYHHPPIQPSGADPLPSPRRPRAVAAFLFRHLNKVLPACRQMIQLRSQQPRVVVGISQLAEPAISYPNPVADFRPTSLSRHPKSRLRYAVHDPGNPSHMVLRSLHAPKSEIEF